MITPSPEAVAQTVDIMLPVYNEESTLANSVRQLHHYLTHHCPYGWSITVVDNASTDATPDIARQLGTELDGVRLMRLERKGRGLALRESWSASTADIVAYMDIDLSTGLDAFVPMVAPLVSGHSDVAIGSRLSRTSTVARGPQREFISRVYNLILRVLFGIRFRDAQCGFKAARTPIAQRLLPLVRDDGWFFDTELLLIAEYNGLRIHEMPVDWIDDPDSRVNVARTARDDLRGCIRMVGSLVRGTVRADLGPYARRPLTNDFGRQLVAFAAIGTASTAATLAAFVALQGSVQPVWAVCWSMLGTALFNIWATRHFTFGHRGRADRWRQYLGSAASLVLGTAASMGVVAIVDSAGGGTWARTLALLGTLALTATARLTVLRTWVFSKRVLPAVSHGHD